MLTFFQEETVSTFLLLVPGQITVTASDSRGWETQMWCCLVSESRSEKEIRSSSSFFFLEHLPLNSVIMLKGSPDHMEIPHVSVSLNSQYQTADLVNELSESSTQSPDLPVKTKDTLQHRKCIHNWISSSAWISDSKGPCKNWIAAAFCQ